MSLSTWIVGSPLKIDRIDRDLRVVVIAAPALFAKLRVDKQLHKAIAIGHLPQFGTVTALTKTATVSGEV
jgi:hypothetical protein